jgi:NADP-dependent 3-hydroxy acid dehydrogenase YdfG
VTTDAEADDGTDRSPDTALIAGVGPNLGETLAREFADRGATVGLLARSADYLDGVADDIEADGGRAHVLPADLTDRDAVRAAVEEFEAAAGPTDLLVYNAFFTDTRPGTLEDIPLDTLRGDLETNVLGAAGIVDAALDGLRDSGGTVVVTGSPYAHRPTGETLAWDVSAPAVHGLAKSLAMDLERVHVAYAVIDGSIGGAPPDGTAIDAAHVADEYWRLARQPRDAWTFELDLRPADESFRT